VVAAPWSLVTRFAALLVVAASGCFYTDPINQRPSIDIHQLSADLVYRNELVNLEAVANDPDGDTVAFQWRAYACTTEGDCDPDPFYTGIQKLASFKVPKLRTESTQPLQAVFVTLEGKDDYGATAKPIQQLVLAVGDRAPDLELRKVPRHAYVVNTPIDVFAKVGDSDDGPDAVALDWHVFSPPAQPAYTLVDRSVAQDPADPAHLQFGKTFTPAGIGDWDLSVTATDPIGNATNQHLAVTVVADQPPCLAQWAPAASTTASATIPITDPTLFEVLVVADDLDPFPSVPDAVIGQTEFLWSMVPPGGSRVALASVAGPGVALDPASYTPGDIVELRVEIQDRQHIAVNCPDAQLTCSVISDPLCTQRLTWKVEIR
jgi:hypothetical protein